MLAEHRRQGARAAAGRSRRRSRRRTSTARSRTTRCRSRCSPASGTTCAGATLTFGFGRRQVLVDRTTARVVGRSRTHDDSRRFQLRLDLHRLAGSSGPDAEFNRALLDLGRDVCRPDGAASAAAVHCGSAARPAARASMQLELAPMDARRGSRRMSDAYVDSPAVGRSLMSSLRDIGYDLPSAVADLVDNAHRRERPHDRRRPRRRRSGLVDPRQRRRPRDVPRRPRRGDALRHRTPTTSSRSLGHFGLGLKTASLSQCRDSPSHPASRRPSRTAIRAGTLTKCSNATPGIWSGSRLARRRPELRRPDCAMSDMGTVVLWENLDRVLPRRPTEGMTARVIATATAGGARPPRDGVPPLPRRRGVRRPRPPRADRSTAIRSSRGIRSRATKAHTQALPPQVLDYEDSDGRTISIEVRPFVLPAQHLFSSPEAHRRAGGPRRWNRHQGFYIYRRERLIQAGGWNRLRTLDEHAKLARIAIDLPLGDEERFAVDVAKMRVSIPEELRPALRGRCVSALSLWRRSATAITSTLSEETLENARAAHDPEAISISRDWPAILAVVDDVLGHDLSLRDRLLLRLANADPEDIPALAALSSHSAGTRASVVSRRDGHGEGESAVATRSPELRLRSALHRRGLRFRVASTAGAGAPVDRRHRLPVGPESRSSSTAASGTAALSTASAEEQPRLVGSRSSTRTSIATDATDAALTERGWHVVRVWEHESPRMRRRSVAELVQNSSRRSDGERIA